LDAAAVICAPVARYEFSVSDPSQILVVQTVPVNATNEQRQMALAIASVITSVLFQYGHPDVAVALLGETSRRVFHHETNWRAVPLDDGMFAHRRGTDGV
jgi:hypothetical protein